ncbi:2-dehydropantoate 2-reductase [Arsukibacterium sp.]|uniref:ketopantoate reductase family protein n=1 Tax=Arsukibacterium sp. TaxID=1977258 RepID=UPI00299E708E|nr:2-dehydropantoate 2-reductase [Arsukibacterium sp.]MDX1676506.1 2-dehydropantoate 2-reductase [Arsukibacterium sp.]
MASNPSTSSALSWTIVGRGAIGLLAAARLYHAGYSPRLWLKRPAPVELTYTGIDHQQQQMRLPSEQADRLIPRVLIPVKAYDVANAINQLAPALRPDAQLVISHNGIIPFKPLLEERHPDQGLWFLSTSQAAYKPAADQVIHTGLGQSYLAKLTAASTEDDAIITAMTAALGPLTVVSDIQPLLWQKLAVNAAINPLSALENCRNGQLASPRYQQQIKALVTEVCQVATALGYPMQPAQSVAEVYRVIAATANNFSSMQQDVAAKRPTEIHAICGYVCQQAEQLGIAVPANLQMLNRIVALATAN